MGTKKGARRKTARRAFKDRVKNYCKGNKVTIIINGKLKGTFKIGSVKWKQAKKKKWIKKTCDRKKSK